MQSFICLCFYCLVWITINSNAEPYDMYDTIRHSRRYLLSGRHCKEIGGCMKQESRSSQLRRYSSHIAWTRALVWYVVPQTSGLELSAPAITSASTDPLLAWVHVLSTRLVRDATVTFGKQFCRLAFICTVFNLFFVVIVQNSCVVIS